MTMSPDARIVAVDLLRPPPGFQLDVAVLTTYSLDLEALLALPLAVLAHTDDDLEGLLRDPLLLLEALRSAGERIHVFVDHGGIAIPHVARELYAVLEPSVHPTRARNGGAFHPKLWLARFVNEKDEVRLRVAVLSRNLTFDRSWDLALASEGSPTGRRRVTPSRPLGDLLRVLPALAESALGTSVSDQLETLAYEAERTSFASPDGFDGSVNFHALGTKRGRKPPWHPRSDGSRLLAIAPFVNRTALDTLSSLTYGERTLISRQDALDALAEDALEPWSAVYVLSDAARDEVDDNTGTPMGLHAKLVGIEHGWDVTWFAGSANLTAAAFTGHNVELMASVTGKKGRQGSPRGQRIERFLESGFLLLCEPYRRAEPPAVASEVTAARSALDQARDAVLESDLRVVCEPNGTSWTWTVVGSLERSEAIEIALWPITIGEDQAREGTLPAQWFLPMSRLTAFVAFRLSSPVDGVDDVRLTRLLPAEGLPEGRLAAVLRSLVDTPERLLRFLRALLGGFEDGVGWDVGEGHRGEGGSWGVGLGGETLLEDLLRVASRDAARLEPVRRLFEDLRTTAEGRRLVPDDLYAVWEVVDAAITARSQR